MNKLTKLFSIIILGLLVTACGSNKRDVRMKIHSDPLGAYTLMQVKYEGQEDNDWIYLGPTPITMDKSINLSDATEISLKVIRPGFYEQVKSWKPRDFISENRDQDGIVWVPNMVQQ